MKSGNMVVASRACRASKRAASNECGPPFAKFASGASGRPLTKNLLGLKSQTPQNSKPPGLAVGRFFGGAGFVVHSIFPFYEQIFSFFMIYGRSCDIVNSFDEIFLLAEISLYDLSSQLFAITTGAVYAAMIAPKNLIFAS